MKYKPYATRMLPNGKTIEFYKNERDTSELSEVDRLFGDNRPVFWWRIPGIDAHGHMSENETPDECKKRVYEDVLTKKERK